MQAGNAVNPVPGIAKVSNTLTDNVNKLNFAPRLGVAVKLTDRMVLRSGYGIFYDRLSNQLGLLESLSLPSYVSSSDINTEGVATNFNLHGSLANPFPTLPLRSQFPVLPQIYAQNVANAPTALGISAIDPHLRTPYYQQYGVNIQTEIGRGFLWQIGYVGSTGRHLPVQTELNQAIVASVANPINGVTTNNTGVNDSALARAPYQGFSNSGFAYLQTSQTSSFNSLQTTVTERLGKATLLVTYMWSRSLDTGSGTSDGTVFTNSTGDQTNPSQAYGPSDFDRTHHAALRFTQPIPNMHWHYARTATGSRIFGGYEFSGVAILQSGLPFSITNPGGAAYYGTDTSLASYAPGATAKTAMKSGRTEDRINAFFNTAAFVGAGNFYGNTGRNILRGPFQRNLDISLIKNTVIHGGFVAEFRAQAFNVTNTPNFNNPTSSEGGTNFGVITTTTGNPRVLQFALKLKF